MFTHNTIEMPDIFNKSGLTSYQILNTNKKITAGFMIHRYPACCGINIVDRFYEEGRINQKAVKEEINDLFLRSRTMYAPTIQFVAINKMKSKWDDTKKEHIFNGYYDEYEYPKIVKILIEVFNATPIHEFHNHNSGNKCVVYQGRNPGWDPAKYKVPTITQE